jgi:2-polyprenyl-3-methyl-5-hydroxy-6-metoxy-1,4-benzoquinol methylase
VTGPSSAGKSTLIENRDRFGITGNRVRLGSHVQANDFARGDLIHYNLLAPVVIRPGLTGTEQDFLDEPIFRRILDSGVVDRCIVVVASVDDLLTRMSMRGHVEHDRDTQYDRAGWTKIVQRLNLHAIYERMFEALDEKNIPIQVLFSCGSDAPTFLPSDRVFTHANLRGRYTHQPSEKRLTALLNDPFCHYQEVDLPGGIKTHSKGYGHLTGRASFKTIMPANCLNQSFLDIGCALGLLLYTAERLGGSRLMGIDLNEGRHRAAREIGAILNSSVVFLNANINEVALQEKFDHVFAMNVIHHIHDYRRFLDLAARATRKTFTIEFPGIDDQVYGAGLPMDAAARRALNSLPLVGVSTRKADQANVFTPTAIERILMDDLGHFDKVEVITGTIRGRLALRFSHSKAAG